MSDIQEEQKRLYKIAEENDIQILSRWQDPTIEDLKQENKRLNNIIDECANEILKELQENHHLSYGVALAIRQKLINYNELKGDNK